MTQVAELETELPPTKHPMPPSRIGRLGRNLTVQVLVAIVLIYGILVASDSAVYSTAITELADPNRLGATQAAQTSISFSASVVAPEASRVAEALSRFSNGPLRRLDHG